MKDRLVYSSESGRICPRCSRPVSSCTCKKERNPDKNRQVSTCPSDGIIRVMREKKGHKGKTVTNIMNIPLKNENLKELAKELKTLCGTGGSAKDGSVLLQGDHREVVMNELIKRGYMAKLAGG